MEEPPVEEPPVEEPAPYEVLAPAAPAEPALPEQPALPSLTPCPPGWTEVPPQTPDDVATCSPWPLGTPEVCTGTEAHFPGEPGCTRIGTVCPESGWSDAVPHESNIVYVRAGVPPGGVGSQYDPVGTIGEATTLATPGTVIALSKGTYDEIVTLPRDVTLVGACVAETVIAPSRTAGALAAITAAGENITVRNLRVSGEHYGVLVYGARNSLHMEDVLIESNRSVGWWISNASATGESVVIRDVRSRASDGSLGYGIQVTDGGKLHLSHGIIERHRFAAMEVRGAGSVAEIEDTVVRDGLGTDRDRSLGIGLIAWNRAHVQLRRSLFENNREFGIFVSHQDTSVVASDVIVQDTEGSASIYPEETGDNGYGVLVRSGASFTLERGLVTRNRFANIDVFNEGTTAHFYDIVSTDAREEESTGSMGDGILVTNGAHVDIERGIFLRSRRKGIFAVHPGTVVGMSDITIIDTMGESDGSDGCGMYMGAGVVAELNRGRIERSRRRGVVVVDDGTRFSANDLTVRDTMGEVATGDLGDGLTVQWGALATVKRSLFERNRKAGVSAFFASAELTLEDVTVRDTRYESSSGDEGTGLTVGTTARASVSRGRFEGNQNVGVVVVSARTSLHLADAQVLDTVPGRDGKLGVGMALILSSECHAERVVVQGNRMFGVAVVGSSFTFEDLVVHDTQPEEFDGSFGRGLHADSRATISGARAIISSNHEVGMSVIGTDTSASITDVVVRDTLPRAHDGQLGYGVGVYDAASLELDRFLVRDNTILGLQIGAGAHVKLYDGAIEGHEIGVNVGGDDPELECLENNIRYGENLVQWRSDVLPLPSTDIPMIFF